MVPLDLIYNYVNRLPEFHHNNRTVFLPSRDEFVILNGLNCVVHITYYVSITAGSSFQNIFNIYVICFT